jgi:hypothetical protein
MAVWQFRFSLLPKKGVSQKHETFPKFLLEYKANFNNANSSVDEVYENYWEGFDLEVLSRRFEDALPVIDSWSENLSIYGYEDGSRVEVSEDEIYVKFDTRQPDYTFLREVITTAKSYDCVCVLEEDGQLMFPDFELILEHLSQSRAYRFCEDPDKVLREVRDISSS